MLRWTRLRPVRSAALTITEGLAAESMVCGGDRVQNGSEAGEHEIPRRSRWPRVANGARCQKISVAPQQVSQSRRNQKFECKLRGLRGNHISYTTSAAFGSGLKQR